ncbi:hypothetical protein AB0O75_45220 [Streptomyces sp. NPDC088921]|uniref:hypothetical protein n=1 Tax=unclassified Streptomyces TaxID=2593676 RepID=UPI00343BA5C8
MATCPPQLAALLGQTEQLRLYIDDLETVQCHCEQHFPVLANSTQASRSPCPWGGS